MLLRPATPADLPAIADAWYAMMDEAGLLLPSVDPRWRDWLIEDFGAGMALGAQVWYVTEADHGTIVATGALFFRGGRSTEALTGRTATVAGVYTLPEHRRRGYAKALVERLLQVARERGCRSVRLRASDQGRRLYETLGFSPSDEMVLAL